MLDIRFDENGIIITGEIRKIILDIINENNYSDSNTDDINFQY